jgi:hypothetical protein
VLPLAAAYPILGYSETTLFVVPLAFSLLGVMTAFLLGKTLFNARVGLLATLLAAVIPLEIFYASSLLPDTFIPAYVGLTLLFFALGQTRGDKVFLILSGFFLLCAFQARATSGILIIPLVASAWWSSRRNLWTLTLPVAAFLILLVLLWGLIALLGGDFLSQLELLARDATAADFVGTGEILGHLREMVGLNGDFGLLYTLLGPILVYAAIRAWREEAYRLPLVAFLSLYLFFEFGSTTLTSYRPIWKQTRFLTILTIPACVLLAAVSVRLLSLPNRRVRLSMFAVLSAHILLSTLLPIYNQGQTQWAADHTYPYETTFEKLQAYEDIKAVAIANVWWAVRGDVYSRLYGRRYEYIDLENTSVEDLEPGTAVVYDPILFTPYEGFFQSKYYYPALQGLPEQVPVGWHLLFVVAKPTHKEYPIYVYRVD